MAQDGGYEYAAVVLGAPEQDAEGNNVGLLHYKDIHTLFDWAFDGFSYKTLLSKNEPVGRLNVNLSWNQDSVVLVPETDFATVVSKDMDAETIIRKVVVDPDTVDAPVTKGQVYGKVELYVNVDQKLGEVNLVASESLERSDLLVFWQEVQNFLQSPWFWAGIILLALLLIGYIILNIVHNRRRRKKKMRRVNKKFK